MSMDAALSLLPILGAVTIGWVLARSLFPSTLANSLIRLIGPMVGLLLFLMGMEFAGALASLEAIGYVLRVSSLLVLTTTAFPCLLLTALAVWERPARFSTADDKVSFNFGGLRAPFWQCAKALGMVCLGIAASIGPPQLGVHVDTPWLPSSGAVLVGLMVLIGVDLANVKLRREVLSWRMLWVPVAVVVGSSVGGIVVHLATGEDLRVLLALSSGFGWFTLSSALVGSLSSELHGATALLVDLGRELIAIVLLYLSGRNNPNVGIAAAGATAMDSTLPIVRQACHREAVPVALISGFLLTVAAPFLITSFLA